MTDAGPLLVALDIDGTILAHDGSIPEATTDAVTRLRDAGHEVMLATGRSVADTMPIHERLGLDSRFVVSANGATVLERAAPGESDPHAPNGYVRRWIETFDPSDVLVSLRTGLPGARYAVESPEGVFRFSGRFPAGSFESRGEQVPFEDLLGHLAQRLVVVAPDQTTEEFADAIEQVGLHHVSYSVGWTQWLDIAPAGVNKASALERVRSALGIPRARVVAAGDGRNDIEMLAWAAEQGRAVAMNEAPQEVIDVATSIAQPFDDDGLGRALDDLTTPADRSPAR